MAAAHEKGTPVIRPLFYDFPADQSAWEVEDQYLFGPDILVAPVLYPHAEQPERTVYLPEGTNWIDPYTKKTLAGGQTVTIQPALDQLPLFIRESAYQGLSSALTALQ